ncbi:MAG TPA: thiamine pyrophosphate-dependent dehydrogenase E1 component subunit alpha [Candidatus Dormibacteraeota bacterium]|nr:thiamine pyrophosphate-dependent dehydrogenase E1 component subunit alpha [Candidatus Dormibacteraeota bacterium]
MSENPATVPAPPALSGPDWVHAYRLMLTIRLFEDRVNDLYQRKIMPGLAHLSSGEEGVSVGVCTALRDDDYITSTHRGHGHCLAKGAAADLMFAELLGKAAGYCGGKGGSMHIADQARGNLGANAIVGGSLGIATGAGLSIKQRRSDQVAVSFIGDGALGQGVLYEVMNMASLWQLPVIYVCENNLYGEYTLGSETVAGRPLDRATAFGIPGGEVDGQDVRAVYSAMAAAVEQARAGGGPSFLLCSTYRYFGHHVGDVDRGYYRSREEEQFWREQRDPITLAREWLEAEGLADRPALEAISLELAQELDAAVEFAVAAPFPNPDQVATDVFA